MTLFDKENKMESVEESKVSDQPSQSSGAAGVQETSNNDSVAYETYKKVLSERKRDQAKASELEEKLRMYEQKEQEAQGRHQEVNQALRDELAQLKAQNLKKDEAYAWNVASGQVKTMAAQMKCSDPEAFMRLVDTKDLRSVEVDEGFNVNSEDAKRLVERYKEKYKHLGLFGHAAPQINDMSPMNMPARSPKKLSELSTDELMNVARQMDKR